MEVEVEVKDVVVVGVEEEVRQMCTYLLISQEICNIDKYSLLSYTQFLFLKLKGGRGGGRGGENRVRSLGSQEKVYDQVVADMDLASAVRGIGVIEGVNQCEESF